MADAAWENRGPDNCAECGAAFRSGELGDRGVCAGCVDAARYAGKLSDDSGELLCEACSCELRDAREERQAAEFDAATDPYLPRSAFL